MFILILIFGYMRNYVGINPYLENCFLNDIKKNYFYLYKRIYGVYL